MKELKSSAAKKNLSKEELAESEEDEYSPYKMEKSQEEILAQGYLQNFFECPYNYQEVIFMMVKGD